MQDKLDQLAAINVELENAASQLQNGIAERQVQLNQIGIKLIETRAKMQILAELINESAQKSA